MLTWTGTCKGDGRERVLVDEAPAASPATLKLICVVELRDHHLSQIRHSESTVLSSIRPRLISSVYSENTDGAICAAQLAQPASHGNHPIAH